MQALHKLKRWCLPSEKIKAISEEERKVLQQILHCLLESPFSDRYTRRLIHTLSCLEKGARLINLRKAATIYEEDGRYAEAFNLRKKAIASSLSSEEDHANLRRLETLIQSRSR